MNDITVILACFNRKEKTLASIESLVKGNSSINFKFIIVDDNSDDGTYEAIKELPYEIDIIRGNGNLFWCGGMRLGLEIYFKKYYNSDCLLINDDVEFFEHSIEKMIQRRNDRKNTVIVGATKNRKNNYTYGLRKHRSKRGIYLDKIEPSSEEIKGDTFNANCVLISNNIMREVGNMDYVYSHSMGDYDLGFNIHRKGYELISSEDYVGFCEENSLNGTWQDTKLKRIQRLKKKETLKGLPFKEWFHFLNKNYGFINACIYSLIPYIKILIGK